MIQCDNEENIVALTHFSIVALNIHSFSHSKFTHWSKSGRRDSNPRHSAWKADALPTELLPLVKFKFKNKFKFKFLDLNLFLNFICGGDRIRTYSVKDTRFTVWPGSPTPAHPRLLMSSKWKCKFKRKFKFE